MRGDSNQTPSCPNCNEPLRSLEPLTVRVGGMGSPWHLVLGALAEGTESVTPLDAYRCDKCGRIELYDREFSLPTR